MQFPTLHTTACIAHHVMQLNCARLCGVDEAVLARAADVIELQQAGAPVTRLELEQLEARDQQYWQLMQRLAALNLSSEESVLQLLKDVLTVEGATPAKD